VLGPCRDGGYYLVGMRKPHPELFENIPWSTGNVLESTVVKTRDQGLRTELLPLWTDLDTFEDLRDFYRRYSEEAEPDLRRGKKTFDFLSRLPRFNS